MIKRSRNYTDEELGYPTGAFGRIPSFANRDEEAEFRDTHDTTDFPDEFTPVEVTVSPDLLERMTIRLDQEDRRELQRRASEMGIGPSTLIRIWVKERLAKGA